MVTNSTCDNELKTNRKMSVKKFKKVILSSENLLQSLKSNVVEAVAIFLPKSFNNDLYSDMSKDRAAFCISGTGDLYN